MEGMSLRFAMSMLVQLALCTAPLCAGLKLRRSPWARAALAAGIFVAGELAQDPIRQGALTGNALVVMLSFGITLAVTCADVLLICKVSVWQALFCCTAGYICQNLVSGAADAMDSLLGLAGLPSVPWPGTLLVALAAIYPLYLGFFVRPVRRHGLADISEPEIILVAVAVVATVIGLDAVIKGLGIRAMGAQAYLMARMSHGVLCAFTLYAEQKILAARRLATEREVERRMAAERERQYELSRANIDAINLKCHDIKHQIRSLAAGGRVADGQALEDLASEVAIYDCAVQTGNAALDTILTEKSLVCSREAITLATIADGRALAGLEPQEIYSFFGNALDNAIEAVRRIDEPERRLISLNVRRAGGMCVVNIENSCLEEPRFEGGLPQTTKGDASSHGFGTRSMRALVERRGGTLDMGWEEGLFHVDALLPLP